MLPLEATWVVPVFTVIGTLVGAAISATFGWFDSRRRSAHEERRDWMALAEQHRMAMTNRASEFLAATHHALLSTRDVALAPNEEKHAVEKLEIWPTVDRVNRCLTAVRVNDAQDVVAAADALDRALVELSLATRTKEWEMDSWDAERRRVIGDLQQQFTSIVRNHARKLEEGRPVVV